MYGACMVLCTVHVWCISDLWEQFLSVVWCMYGAFMTKIIQRRTTIHPFLTDCLSNRKAVWMNHMVLKATLFCVWKGVFYCKTMAFILFYNWFYSIPVALMLYRTVCCCWYCTVHDRCVCCNHQSSSPSSIIMFLRTHLLSWSLFAAVAVAIIVPYRGINLIWFDSIWFNSIWFNSIQFNSIQFNSIQFNSIRFNSIRFDSIQLDSIWFILVSRILCLLL